MGRDFGSCVPATLPALFQSTRPHGARPGERGKLGVGQAVSIHAPTRGATHSRAQQLAEMCCFNPRAHAGCDQVPHTEQQEYRRCFNPRAHAGCDATLQRWSAGLSCFNPRAHAGCDLMSSTRRRPIRCFNPRAHAGCDIALFCQFPGLCPFQSTRPRGVRLCRFHCATIPSSFQSTRPRGVRLPSAHHQRHCAGVSIHAPTRGATGRRQALIFEITFQSTRPRGVRPFRAVNWNYLRCFNPRAHAGCDREGYKILAVSRIPHHSREPDSEKPFNSSRCRDASA